MSPPDLTGDYENAPHIADGDAYPARWAERAARFRADMDGRMESVRYGPGERHTVDLFRPEGTPRGLAVIVHGGYWMRFGPADWSHLARGAVEAGWLAAVPGYTLAPAASIAGIGREVGACLDALAARGDGLAGGPIDGPIDGPIRLAGHSAGGQLVARLACAGAPVAEATAARIERVVSVSGLADLRPLARTAMNATLGLDAAEARAESPALLDPLPTIDLVAWVGADERPEFVRQNALLATAWTTLARSVSHVEEPGRHHFDVVEGLEDAASPLGRAFLD